MIHPDLATMLAVVTTDYPLEPGEAIDFLRPAVDASFNAISVDGECSTNDAVVLLAYGAAAIERTPATTPRSPLALHAVCADLAQQIVADGEGATLRRRDHRHGRREPGRRRKAIAQRIATSPLVKTALFGRDANWGRVLMAAGSAPFNGGYAQLDPALVSLVYNGTQVLVAGAPQHVEPPVDGAVCTIDARPRARRRQRRLPDERPLVRLRAHQRGVPVVSRLVVKVGGAVAARVGRAASSACARRATRSSSCTAPARRSPRRCRGAASPSSSSTAAGAPRAPGSRSCASRWPP